ncbi:hypothetical protein [Desulfofustis glycolicus]|uniref:hypothetical protein n=1 Tax=Desulfofustis glycolicus TaxID=51195 RepID=UPI000934923C|nr:hypothetical protein [Desulfofustis glycolicus]MCB2214786.1 hypothetical protein [Desulfobulbaceae bacterium]
MKPKITYTNEPIGKVRVIAEFLSTPEDLVEEARRPNHDKKATGDPDDGGQQIRPDASKVGCLDKRCPFHSLLLLIF